MVRTTAVWSGRNEGEIDFCLGDDLPTLFWPANLADLELHSPLARAPELDEPTIGVRPRSGASRDGRGLLAGRVGAARAFSPGHGGLPKTSGSKGMQVYLPGRKRLWGRSALVVAQVAMSLMLLTASFLMVRGFQHTLLDGMEFAKDHLLMTTFDPRLVQYDGVQTKQFFKVLKDRLRETPGVESVTWTQNVPMGRDDFDAVSFVPDGFQMPKDRQNFTSVMNTVDEDLFSTMQIPILRGRAFLSSDTADSPRVAIVNEFFAHHYWPGQDAVGKRIRLDRSGWRAGGDCRDCADDQGARYVR